MSKQFTDGYFALVLTVILGLAAIVFVSVTFAFSRGYQSADQEHATYYAERAKAENRDHECLGEAADLSSARECLDNATVISRDAERAEQNLNAQREMAQWAFWMLVVTLIMAAITAIGVFYVWRTLLATQDMASDTKTMALDARKTWRVSS
jgi:hypothetical protein